jgi:hypothetical protein
MKRPWIPLLALTVLLPSCIIVVSPPVSSFRFESNAQRVADSAYVLCTGLDTGASFTPQLRYSFKVNNPSTVQSISETYTGEATGRTVTLNRPLSDVGIVGERLEVTLIANFGQGGLPQRVGKGVSAQAIIPTPIYNPTASRNGATTVTVNVVTTDGSQFVGTYTYGTYANCSTR